VAIERGEQCGSNGTKLGVWLWLLMAGVAVEYFYIFLALAVDQDTLPVRVVDRVAVAGWQWWQSKEEISAVILVPKWRCGCGY
jgi:hypothetical protein